MATAAQEKKSQPDADGLFPNKFTDEDGREWSVKLSVGDVAEFTDRHKLRLGEFTPDNLSIGQLLELAYIGSRWNALASAFPESQANFLKKLEGPSFADAQRAAVNAVINFTLRSLPRERQAKARTKIAAALATMDLAANGPGPASTDSSGLPASTTPTAVG